MAIMVLMMKTMMMMIITILRYIHIYIY